MPCMNCGDDDRDYCESCFSRAKTLLTDLLEWASEQCGLPPEELPDLDPADHRLQRAREFVDGVAHQEEIDDVEPRVIPQQQAEAEILEFFGRKGTLSYSDIADSLHIDLGVIVAACEALVDRGKIAPNDVCTNSETAS